MSTSGFSRVSDFFGLVRKGSASEVFDELDFAVKRTNFQSSSHDRHLYQSYRSMSPFWNLLGFTCVSSTSIFITRIRNFCPTWNHMRHFTFGCVLGTTYSLLYHYLWFPFRVRRVCLLEDNFYSTVCKTIINSRPDAEQWNNVFQRRNPDPERRLFVMPNFQFSGLPAVISLKEREDPPLEGFELEPKQFLEDIDQTNRKYHHITYVESGEEDALSTEALSSTLKNNISLFLTIKGIDPPVYFQNALTSAHTVPQLPVDYLHLTRHDDSTGTRGDVPIGLRGPTDILLAHQARKQAEQAQNSI